LALNTNQSINIYLKTLKKEGNKMGKKRSIRKVPKSNWLIIETGTKSMPLTFIYFR
jgi:hypothetical protein